MEGVGYTITVSLLRPIGVDRALAVASARYTSNGLCILPLLVPFTANTCRR